MDLGLNGRVAVVMAASRGLGRAVATALAAEGCDLAIASRDAGRIAATAAVIRAATGRRVISAAVDVTKADAIAAFAATVQDTYGRVDILINNGGGPPPGTFDSLDDAQWAGAAELLVMNVVRTTRAFLPHLRATAKNPGPAGACARIITVTSTSTKEVLANLMLSNSLRAAVAGWSKTLARELAPEGITVNCLAPGTIGTERIDELVAANAKRGGITTDAARAAILARIPAGRFGKPEEFAATAAFLASVRASYITGATVVVDGGMMVS